MPPDQILKILKEAIALQRAGRAAEAEPLYRQVLQHDRRNPAANQNLGLILHDAGKHENALELMNRALEAAPDVAIFHRNLGTVYRSVQQPAKAVLAVRRAVDLAPADGMAWGELGISLDTTGELDEAISAYRRAIDLLTPIAVPAALASPAPANGSPTMELARAHYNLGSALGRRRNTVAAMEQYEASIRIVPSFAEPHRNRAGILFQQGRLGEAWAEYEWRWRCADYPGKFPNFLQPKWDGSPLNGRTILLWWEQGFGDTIQFCRYAPQITAAGGRVVLLVQKELKRLMKTLDGVADLAVSGERKIDFDTHSSLMSVPGCMGISLENIPSTPAYLRADPQDAQAWDQRLREDGAGFRVGIVWAGAAAHKQDQQRSIPLAQLEPILAMPGALFYSLQLGEQSDQIKDLPAGIRLIDHSAHIHDFADSAALIDRLDLLITVDTAPAHLAGALGKETWMLLAHEPDFRWMADRDNPSRWYPSMRLFRQTVAGDWKSVIERVRGELEAKVR